MKYLKQFFPLIVVFGLSLFSIIPFFHPGFFPIHDNTQVQRVFEMTRSLKDGIFPVRWVSDLGFGYGYPIFNFYAPFAYYLGSIINLLGFDVLTSTKIMMALGIILSGISMYFLAKEFWGKFGGIFSALLYVFAPYHAVDIYVRGDVAEFWAYAFTPLVFYFLWKVHKSGKLRFVAGGALSFAGLIVSHNLTALMVAPFILVFLTVLFLINKKNRVSLLSTTILGLLIAAFYWLPALLEINHSNVLSQIGGGADYKDHFVCLSQLWYSPWGFGGSAKGCIDGISFALGKINILIFLTSIVVVGLAAYLKKIDREKVFLLTFFILAVLFSVFLTLNYSKPIWDLIGPMAFFQYPWRFLLMVAFFISLISGSLLYYGEKRIKNKWVIFLAFSVLILLIVIFNAKNFMAQKYLSVSPSDYTNDYFLKFRTSQISSEYMPQGFSKPKSYNQLPKTPTIIQGNINIKTYTKKTGKYLISFVAGSESKILMPIAYFPAWRVTLDGKNYEYTVENNGLLVNLPKGEHSLEFNFRQTPIEVFSNFVSFSGILLLVIGIILRRKNL